MIGILTVLTIILSGCSVSYELAGPYDDVYYVPGDKPVKRVVVEQKETVVINDQPEISEEYYTDQASLDGDTIYYEEEYYEEDINDNYDYEYSARIRRFHQPAYQSYYNDYYTNMYWYEYDPWYWGTSIYLGSGYWYPTYSYYRPSSCYYHGYNSWYYDYGYHHHGYGWGGGYWNGYHTGYNHGYYDGYYASNYYNSYDKNSNYYGRREGSKWNTTGTRRGDVNNGNSGRSTVNRRTESSFGERYEAAIASGRVKETERKRTEVRPGESSRYQASQSVRSSTSGTRASQGDNGATRVTNDSRRQTSQYQTGDVNSRRVEQSQVKRTDRPSGRYERSEQTGTQKPKAYRNPNYAKPKSSNEYSRPSNRRDVNKQSRQNNSGVKRSTTTPSNRRTYKAPAQQNRNSNSYSSPKRSSGNKGYTPSRSSSGSNNSYTPSRSSSSSKSSGSSNRNSSGSSSSSSRRSGGRH
ncbi:MAG: hypothetical protein JEZ03_00640 [Bacteroidales bacterium]|nr:hypothetical protein [Bacteroidales bacterium]